MGAAKGVVRRLPVGKTLVYDKPCDAEELISTVKKLSDEELEEKTPELLGDHPNTYTITKHLAEHEIKGVEGLFPCTIVRPSMSKLT
jgi:fatty acyl-CoA reductase